MRRGRLGAGFGFGLAVVIGVGVLFAGGCARTLLQAHGSGLASLRPGMDVAEVRAVLPIGEAPVAAREIGGARVLAWELSRVSRRVVVEEPLPAEDGSAVRTRRVGVRERVWLYFATRPSMDAGVEAGSGEAGRDGLSLVMWGLPSEWPSEEAVRRVVDGPREDDGAPVEAGGSSAG